MRVLGIDFETTGLDPKKDYILEVGGALFDCAEKKPLYTLQYYLHHENYPTITEEITKLTGITDSLCKEFKTDPFEFFQALEAFCIKHNVDFLCAHNARDFDKPFMLMHLQRMKIEAPKLKSLEWIDTRYDLPVEFESRKLKYLAADHGFISPFQHRAVFDTLTMMRILSEYDISEVVRLSREPWCTVKALVGYEDKEKAKEKKYLWEKCGTRTYPKAWVKRLRQCDLEAERTNCPFEVVVLDNS